MEDEEDDRGNEDEALSLELGQRVALVDIVPLGPGHTGRDGAGASQSAGVGAGLGDRVRRGSKVGKV